MHCTRLLPAWLLALGTLWHAPCAAADAVIREAGLAFQLPAHWRAQPEEARLPSGQLMQRWVREPIQVDGRAAMPGLIAVAMPAPADVDLLLTSRGVLSREPYRKTLGVDVECVKCMRYKLKMSTGTATTIAPDSTSFCDDLMKSGKVEACSAEPVNALGLKIEPSWAHRFVKATPGGPLKVTLIHALVNGKFVDISFWYPPQAGESLEAEIAEIAASIRLQP